MADAGAQGEIATELDGILEIPGAEEAAPSQLIGRGHYLKAADGTLQKRGEAGEGGLAELARGGILIVLHALKPDSGGELVDAVGDLQVVGEGEEVAAIPDPGGIVRTGRGDASETGSGDAAVDDDTAGAGCPSRKIEGGGELGEEGRIEIEAGSVRIRRGRC